ncbi:hypothetical protein IL308_05625 [Lactococcus lactis]|uniref:hypothetical protein n=1 Tax=Lactococcus lactis TaxID=1358 RepID=UPI0019129D80|nr:hypothetical protein [Lactococcus lactis]MBK5076271.1 hypothetical protein [Lactococcus lactis]WDA68875.1 hypothetical protein IL310_02160 [Lactococcus lactis]
MNAISNRAIISKDCVVFEMRILINESNFNKRNYKLFESGSSKEIFDWLNELLIATKDFSLLGELNEMQGHAGVRIGVKNGTRFDNKYDIPFYFINLVIKEYGLKVI